MSMPMPINVNDTQYYISAELELSNPDLYVNARSTKNRNVITTLQIPITEYIFANKTKTNDLWNVLSAKSKIAKLLISKDWVDTFLKNKQSRPKIIRRKTANPTSIVDTKVASTKVDAKVDTKVDIVDAKVDINIDDTNDEAEIIEPVPPVLHLNDNEKFYDTEGNALEIMTCGERHEDRIYFDMTDVSKAFEMPNLRKTLINKVSAYRRGFDYKVFITPKRSKSNHQLTGVTTNKRTFLTYNGLLKVVNVTRVVLINQECIQCWLNNLNLSFRKNTEHTLRNGKKNTSGTIYLATVSCLDAVKIGYTTACYSTLHARYKTVYGEDVEIHHKIVDNAQRIEKVFHNAFKHYNMSGELFNKEGYTLYKEYLEKL